MLKVVFIFTMKDGCVDGNNLSECYRTLSFTRWLFIMTLDEQDNNKVKVSDFVTLACLEYEGISPASHERDGARKVFLFNPYPDVLEIIKQVRKNQFLVEANRFNDSARRVIQRLRE